MREQGGGTASGLESVASTVQRLAVLLAAGVTPAAGWGYLADGAVSGIVRSVADGAAAGQPVAHALLAAIGAGPETMSGAVSTPIPGSAPGRVPGSASDANPTELTVADEQAWRGLAAAWQVATEAGASLAPSLRQFASSLRDLAQTRRDISVALAGPAATARMVLLLPVIGVMFGLALGFDTLGVLFTTTPGWVCLFLGVALMVAARAWNRRLVARAQPVQLTPGLDLELMAIAVSGGGSLSRATAAVDEARVHCGLTDADASETVESVLVLSRRAGVPAAELLRSQAEESRRTARTEGQRTAATLAVTLMLPLGLCILPAFMLLGVAPLLIAIVSSTVDAF